MERQVSFSVIKWAQTSQNWIFCDEKTFTTKSFFGSMTCHRNDTLRTIRVHINAVKWCGQDALALHVVSSTLAGDMSSNSCCKEDSHVVRLCKSMCHFVTRPLVIFTFVDVSFCFAVTCPLVLPRVFCWVNHVSFFCIIPRDIYWSMCIMPIGPCVSYIVLHMSFSCCSMCHLSIVPHVVFLECHVSFP